MYENKKDGFNLPQITSTSHGHPTAKMSQEGLLALVKARKKQIKNRIYKTEQQQQAEIQCRQENDTKLRNRLITDIPIYHHKRKNNSFKMSYSFSKDQKNQQSLDRKRQPFIGQIRKINTQKQNHDKQLIPNDLRIQLKQSFKNDDKSVDEESIQIKTQTNHKSVHHYDKFNSYYQKPTQRKQSKIQQIFFKTPVNPKARNQKNTSELKRYLIQQNMFFGKINPIVTLCIIKLNRLFIIEKKKPIYKRKQEINSFFIILEGKIKISNSESNFKKICEAGQTIYEEVLFSKPSKKIALETARAITKSFLVQIKAQNYARMKTQMLKYGYKYAFTEMQSLIKRNFIMKNWLRNQKQKF